ncbi:MAG: hypothetical protein ACUZ8E_11310 [Candidatus Anammoxibacter sp.]
MQVTLNAPNNLPRKTLQKRIKEFEDRLQEEANTLSDQEENDSDEQHFDAAARSPEVKRLLSQLSLKL